MSIPNNAPGAAPILLKAGMRVMFIQTAKGIYLKLGEKIIKINMPEGGLKALSRASNGGNGGGEGPSSGVAS